jgi:hypothetical protein
MVGPGALVCTKRAGCVALLLLRKKAATRPVPFWVIWKRVDEEEPLPL